MGKRKSKRAAPTKAKMIQPLDTQFDCPFCNHEKVCEVKMYVFSFISNLMGFNVLFCRDRDRNVGFISCRVCQESYQTNINYLSEPIDVYSDWIDACEEANK